MLSKPDSTANFEQFLKNGAQLVRQTEPKTALWFALKDKGHLAIFDIFFNEEGREAHFAGQVANALKENAPQLVQGGWEQGVLANVNHYDLIAANHFDKDRVLTAKEASYIVVQAKPGKNQELELFLKEAAKLIDKTEPNTYLWVALKTSKNSYAIFDAFQDKAALNTHFSGKVAAALEENAGQLVAGGWEKGVLANVHQYQIIAAS